MLNSQTAQIVDADLFDRALRHWFVKPPGSLLAEQEQAVLARSLPNLFGYHILQLGDPISADLLGSSRIAHQIVTNAASDPRASNTSVVLQCAAGALPIASDSIDVAVLPHTLEFNADPHQILREVERVLIGEGHVVICALNPWSLWGLWRLVLAWKGEPPWCGRFLTAPRLKDWLQLLGLTSCRRIFCFIVRHSVVPVY